MCGIVGIYNLNNTKILKFKVKAQEDDRVNQL